MLKLFTVVLFMAVTTASISQTTTSDEIVAEGWAKIKIKPDVAAFRLTVEKTDSVEKNAIKDLNAGIEELVSILDKVGFTTKTIKISDYDISSSMNEENKKTYSISNTLAIETGINNKLINALYLEIERRGIEDLDVSYETKLSDSLDKASRVRLVQLAIADAKANAGNICKSLDIKLVKIKQVRKYNENSIVMNDVELVKFTPPKIVGDSDINYNTSFDKYQVEDVELEEKITIVYEILNSSAAQLLK